MLLTGIHPRIGSEMLSHSSVAFTLDTYSHIVLGLQKATAKRLDELLRPVLAETEDVSKMLAIEPETDTASGQIRTVDRRFTKPLLYP